MTSHIRHSYFRQYFRFCLRFLRSLFFSQLKWPFQNHKNKNSQWFPVCIYPHGWRVSQLQRCPKNNGAKIETWIQSWRFLLHMAIYLFLTVRISTNHSNSILVHFVSWFFHELQTCANQWLLNYHINIISSNILSLGSFSRNTGLLLHFGVDCTIP